MNESLETTIERLENELCQAEIDLDRKDCIIRELEERILDLENKD